MKKFHQEVVRVVLVDAQNRCITKVDISRGTVNQSLAHPREIFRPVIIHSPSADTSGIIWPNPFGDIWHTRAH
jgi:DNA repair protein RadC